jgi:hypothetical protein
VRLPRGRCAMGAGDPGNRFHHPAFAQQSSQ